MKICENENTVKLLESRESNERIIIVMELCAMDLSDLWKNHFNRRMPEVLAITVLKQLMKAFYSIHQNKILHRDIKLENIMIKIDKKDLESLKM